MNYINEVFTDQEFRKLKDRKGERTWRAAILEEFGVETAPTLQDGGEGGG